MWMLNLQSYFLVFSSCCAAFPSLHPATKTTHILSHNYYNDPFQSTPPPLQPHPKVASSNIIGDFTTTALFLLSPTLSHCDSIPNENKRNKCPIFETNSRFVKQANYHPKRCMSSSKSNSKSLLSLFKQEKDDETTLLATKTTNTKATSSNRNPVSFYNDDAFGLVFLTSLFITKDYLFCLIFAGFSFVAVVALREIPKSSKNTITDNDITLSKSNILDNEIIPGLVALSSFLITLLLNVAIPSVREISLSWNDVISSTTTTTTTTTTTMLSSSQIEEIIICSISFIYAMYQSFSNNTNKTLE